MYYHPRILKYIILALDFATCRRYFLTRGIPRVVLKTWFFIYSSKWKRLLRVKNLHHKTLLGEIFFIAFRGTGNDIVIFHPLSLSLSLASNQRLYTVQYTLYSPQQLLLFGLNPLLTEGEHHFWGSGFESVTDLHDFGNFNTAIV